MKSIKNPDIVYRTAAIHLTAICLAVLAFMSTNAHAIPFSSAIDNAAIIQSSIDNVDRKAMIIGNGDMNALIFSRGNDLIMHVAKNDVWDARLITAQDGPLLKVNVGDHSWTGGGRSPSWNHPYPTQTPPCVIRIPLSGKIVNTKLDLRRGLASITTASGTVTIRALARANVFYIEAENAISLEGFPQRFLPAAETQQNDTIVSVKQNLPGDIDYQGMVVFSVKESRGNRHAVSVVTSRKTSKPLEKATQLVKSTLDQEAAVLIQNHEEEWRQYWSKSGVELGNKDFQNWWYRQLYYFRCLSRPGSYAIALQGGYNSKAGWHGTWTVNYNAQQAFWCAFSSNHPELAEPFIDLLNDYHPRARRYAKTVFSSEGAATPHNLWPFEPDPEVCKSVNKRQFAFLPWSYGIGTTGHLGHILWLHYDYKRDSAYLQDKIYPILKDYALFYASFAEQCKVSNGKVVLGPSVDPEHGGYGIDNSPYDLGWAKHTLRAAIQAATDLDVDRELVTRWSNTLNKLPYYPLSGTAGEDIIKVPGVDGYNIITPVVPLFPAEQASWFSPESEKALFKRTIQWIQTRYNKNNSVVMLNVARARLSMTDDAYTDTMNWFKGKEQPNGLFYWQAHGFYMSEQTAVAGLINEFLLQSVENIIRVFPAFPKNQDAKFTSLRARGGFLVTAEQKDGEVARLEITSTAGGKLRMVSPWSSPKVKFPNGSVLALTPDSAGIVELATKKGQTLVFDPALTN